MNGNDLAITINWKADDCQPISKSQNSHIWVAIPLRAAMHHTIAISDTPICFPTAFHSSVIYFLLIPDLSSTPAI